MTLIAFSRCYIYRWIISVCRNDWVERCSLYEAICPECGKRYRGWALRNPLKQFCPECGAYLLILYCGKIIKKASTSDSTSETENPEDDSQDGP